MTRILNLYRSVIGKKVIAAVTGTVIILFLIIHVLGNMKFFMGTNSAGIPEIDLYAEHLRTFGAPIFGYGELLWIIRITLLTSLVLHAVTVLQLAVRSRAARPVGYVRTKHVASSLAARWMLWTGLLLLLYIIVHILQFTSGTIQITEFRTGAVYANIYYAFQLWYIALFYVVAMGAVAFHLYHGVWSLFQSLGLDNPDRNSGLRGLARVVAVLLFVGFCSVPVLFFVDVMPEPTEIALTHPSASEG